MEMRISNRDSLPRRVASNPNATPWNVSPQSKLEGRSAEPTPQNPFPPTIVKLKMNKNIKNKVRDEERTLMNWGVANSLDAIPSEGDNRSKEKKEKKDRGKKKKEK